MYTTQFDRYDARLLCESDIVTTDPLRFGHVVAEITILMPQPEFRITFRETVEALVERGALLSVGIVIDTVVRRGRHRLHELETDDLRPILLRETEFRALVDHTTEVMSLLRQSPQMDSETGEDASGNPLDYEVEDDAAVDEAA